ncbi:hypothetical protein KLP28_17045 [Nocardioidaceae bacterium]|nr:hypothetical protein KLP28_17045 [Nocardioidaceae bacterium]
MEGNWRPARLIPVRGIGSEKEAEERATSALLAVLSIVRPLSLELFKPFGASGATRATVECFTEVPFELEGKKIRPDGLVRVSYGKTSWTALVEVKTGTSLLDAEQLINYVKVARAHKFDCVVTISNELSPAAGRHPTTAAIPRANSTVKLHHLSWTQLVTTAVRLHEHIGVEDAEQRWLLAELIRYLQHSASGALSFNDMGSEWVSVRSAAKDRTLVKTDPGALDVVQRWDQLIRYVALVMGAQTGLDVTQQLSRAESQDPKVRMDAVLRQLVESGCLRASLRIPNTVGDLEICADLHSRQLMCSTTVKAPEDKGARGRVGWLTRQLRDTAPGDLQIESRALRAKSGPCVALAAATEDSSLLLDDQKRDPATFTLTMRREMGAGRLVGKGKGNSFIESVENAINGFYDQVLSTLTPWQPRAAQRHNVPEPSDTQTFKGE